MIEVAHELPAAGAMQPAEYVDFFAGRAELQKRRR
jgi:hypothetical protein